MTVETTIEAMSGPTAGGVAAPAHPHPGTRPAGVRRPIYQPDFERFAQLATGHTLVPVWRDLPADIDTPVSVFLRLRATATPARGAADPGERGQGYPPAFLLESVERGEEVGRYSFIGVEPARLIETHGRQITIVESPAGQAPASVRRTTRVLAGDPLDEVKALLGDRTCARVRGLPLFVGGAVGFLGWDVVRFFERLPAPERDTLGLPDSSFMLIDTLIAFDHVQRRMKLIALADVSGGDPAAAYAAAVERIEALAARLRRSGPVGGDGPPEPSDQYAAGGGATEAERHTVTTSTMTQAEFEAGVRRAKEYIAAGDAFQIVLSQRRERRTSADPLTVYRALRMINPSPYMFFLDFGPYQLVGSSPEMQVRLVADDSGASGKRLAEMRPIAGTRPRGEDHAADDALAEELLSDIKERAEHVMLVDLARNDLGRVCTYGTVRVPTLMTVERYSHVMHIVSAVTGELAPGRDAFDLVRATFPAGTLSGAPKIRAMEIINELERLKRGPYGGVVGYFGFDGTMDTCITIRTVVMKDGVASMQAGGGIVADSDPTAEYHESLNKLKAVERAIELAENGIE